MRYSQIPVLYKKSGTTGTGTRAHARARARAYTHTHTEVSSVRGSIILCLVACGDNVSPRQLATLQVYSSTDSLDKKGVVFSSQDYRVRTVTHVYSPVYRTP